MTPKEAASAWVDAWTTGWRNHDAKVIAARYAADCEFLSQPFRPIGVGHSAAAAYARQAFEEEKSSSFVFGQPLVGEDGRAAFEYRAVITDNNGSLSTLAGVTLLHFNDDGLVTNHRDYWAMTDGDMGLDLKEHRT